MDGDDLVACVPGVVETVNKLIRVRPFRSRSVLFFFFPSFFLKKNFLCKRVNKRTLKIGMSNNYHVRRFNGEIGDVVVGRITEVGRVLLCLCLFFFLNI